MSRLTPYDTFSKLPTASHESRMKSLQSDDPSRDLFQLVNSNVVASSALVEPEPLRAASLVITNLPQRSLQFVRQANTTFC